MSPRDRRAVIIGGALVIFAAGWRFAVEPVMTQWRDAREQAEVQRAMVSAIEHRASRLDAMQQRLETKLGPGVAKPIRHVEDARLNFPREVQEMLQKAGMKITRVELQGVRKLREAPGVSMLSIRLEGATNGIATPKVLMQLQTSETLMIVDDLRLAHGNGHAWTMAMVLSTPVTEGGTL